MKMNYEGKQRKELAAAIAEITGEKVAYMKAPTCAYWIGDFTVERNGDLICSDGEVLEELLHELAEKGFTAKEEPHEDATDADGSGLTVTVSVIAASVENLHNLFEAKETLIMKALGISDTSFKVEDDKIFFSWFPEMPEPDKVKAYTEFIVAICRMSKKQKHISATEQPTDNEKFTLRVFLIRLGFIGDEYKTTRRILLWNLSENSAWRNGTPKNEIDTDD